MKQGLTYSGSGRPDAVEHVGAQGDGYDEIFGVANAHYISRLFGRKPVCACIHTEFALFDQKSTIFEGLCLQNIHCTIRFLILTTGKPPDSNSWRVSSDHFFATDFPHFQVQSSLDDAKQVLLLRKFVSCNASV